MVLHPKRLNFVPSRTRTQSGRQIVRAAPDVPSPLPPNQKRRRKEPWCFGACCQVSLISPTKPETHELGTRGITGNGNYRGFTAVILPRRKLTRQPRKNSPSSAHKAATRSSEKNSSPYPATVLKPKHLASALAYNKIAGQRILEEKTSFSTQPCAITRNPR